MTDEQTPEATDPGELDPGAAPDDQADQETGRQKGLRARAQAAETERDTALALVESLRRAEVVRLVTDKLAQPDDLFVLGGATVDELVGEDGLIDPDKVAEAVDAVLEARPGLARAELLRPPRGYQQQGQFQPTSKTTPSRTGWGQVLRK